MSTSKQRPCVRGPLRKCHSIRSGASRHPYNSWSLSHLGYLYPGTTPVMIKLDRNRSCPWPRRDTPALCRLRVLTTISLCLLLLEGIFLSRIPLDVFVTIVLQRLVTRLPLSEVRNRGGNRRVAITGWRYVMTHAVRSSSQCGRSSTSIDASYTHSSTISNITCFEQAIFVLLLEAWTPPGGWSLVYYREPIAEPLLW